MEFIYFSLFPYFIYFRNGDIPQHYNVQKHFRRNHGERK